MERDFLATDCCFAQEWADRQGDGSSECFPTMVGAQHAATALRQPKVFLFCAFCVQKCRIDVPPPVGTSYMTSDG